MEKDASGKIILGKSKGQGSTTPRSSVKSAAETFAKSLTTDDMKERFAQLIVAFEERDTRYSRIINIGEGKSGKSTAVIETAPKPLLLRMFDPDTEQLIPPEMIKSGEVLPIRYYGDHPNKPVSYVKWTTDTANWLQDGFFEAFATVCEDSLSSMITSHMRAIAYKDMMARRTDAKKKPRDLMPHLGDYHVLKLSTLAEFMSLAALPCHHILTAHILDERIYEDSDDHVGFIKKTLNATPALQAGLPPLFSEVYISALEVKKEATNKKGKFKRSEEYVWYTKRQRKFPDIPAGSRMSGKKGRIPERIPQDYRELFKMVNFHYKDKELLV